VTYSFDAAFSDSTYAVVAAVGRFGTRRADRSHAPPMSATSIERVAVAHVVMALAYPSPGDPALTDLLNGFAAVERAAM
jgi:hypothetical protein